MCSHFQKKYLLLNCVVYHLISVFLIQAIHRCSSKLLFLKFSKISQETPALESFSIKLQALRLSTLLKKTLAQVFSCEISQIFNNNFLHYNSDGCL